MLHEIHMVFCLSHMGTTPNHIPTLPVLSLHSLALKANMGV